MNQNEKISRQQFIAVAFCALLGPTIRIVPTLIVPISHEHAWISIAVSIVPLVILAFLMQRFQRSLGEDEGMEDIFIRALGTFAGKFILLCFALWLLLYCAYVLRISAHRFISTIFPASSPLAYIPAMGVLLLLIVLGQFKTLSRMAAIMSPLLGAVLFLVLVLSLPEVHPYTYSTPAVTEIPEILLGTIPAINALSIWAYLSFLEGHVTGENPKARQFIPSLIITTALMTFLCYTTVGNFGPELTERINNPFFVMIRSVHVFGALERIEALVIALWFFTDFFLAGSIIHAAVRILGKVFAINIRRPGYLPREGRWLPWLCALFCAVLSTRLAKTTAEMIDLSMFIVPAVNMVFTFGLMPLVFLIGLIRKKI